MLEEDLSSATEVLLLMAQENSTRKISPSCSYIFTRSSAPEKGFFEYLKLRKRLNDRKKALPLPKAADMLRSFFPDLFEATLYVYKAKRSSTIVEIQFQLRSALPQHQQEAFQEQEPSLSCKVTQPPYANGYSKFDINWQLCSFYQMWKIRSWMRSVDREIRSLNGESVIHLVNHSEVD